MKLNGRIVGRAITGATMIDQIFGHIANRPIGSRQTLMALRLFYDLGDKQKRDVLKALFLCYQLARNVSSSLPEMTIETAAQSEGTK